MGSDPYLLQIPSCLYRVKLDTKSNIMALGSGGLTPLSHSLLALLSLSHISKCSLHAPFLLFVKIFQGSDTAGLPWRGEGRNLPPAQFPFSLKLLTPGTQPPYWLVSGPGLWPQLQSRSPPATRVKYRLVNEWVSEWIKWVNEWVSKWMNGWMIKWVTEWMEE